MVAEPDAPPPEWEADVVLRDGRPARLRPIRPDDADRLVAFYARVSDQSKYFRFFAPYPTLSARDVERFTLVDHDARVALVATLAGEIIGVARYDVLDRSDGAERVAEVAFLVEDTHQGRGLGQLLLEHLAEAARERGVTRFVAEVLPDNEAMIQVFREQGYRVTGAVADGVLRLEFPIEQTDTAIGVMLAREHRAEAASMRAFFDVRGVAVVGASRREDTVGQTLVRNLVRGGFTGALYAVNTEADTVAGQAAYRSVRDIPGPVDLAAVAVPADAVTDVVLDCAAKGVRGLVVVSAGFAETGEEGRHRQRRLLGLARSYGLRLVGPNALGVINTAPDVRVNASLAPAMPARGRIGFFCQSGALGTAILRNVAQRGLGLSTFVSAGNRADVSGNDLLQYWEEDEATEVVLLYLESMGNPRKFSRIARRVARRKPVVAVRSGRTLQGVPVGHAARSSAAPQAAVDAMLRQSGVISVSTVDEMFDVAELLAHQPLPRGPRLAVVGNSDALGLLAADAAVAAGLEVGDPVALGADAAGADFGRALDEAIDDPDVDAVLAVYSPPLESAGTDVAETLAAVGEHSDKPLLSSFLGRRGVPELLRVPGLEGAPGRGSVPSYPAPEAAVRALARVVPYARWRTQPAGDLRVYTDLRPDEARRVVADVLAAKPGGAELDPQQVRAVLAAYGVAVCEQVPVGSVREAIDAAQSLGWDVVLESAARLPEPRLQPAHPRPDITDEQGMRRAWTALSADPDGGRAGDLVVRSTPPAGVPVRVRGVEDTLFGPIVSFGVAGVPSELLGDLAYRVPPVTDVEAAAMVREIRSAPLLTGYRGAEPVDLDALADLVQRVARLEHDLPQLVCIDLCVVMASPTGSTVLHALARAAPVSDARGDGQARRLARMPGDTPPPAAAPFASRPGGLSGSA